MRRIFFTALTLLAGSATAAFAADLPRGLPPVKSPTLMPVGYTWTGFYAGINGGYGWGRSNWNGVGAAADVDGGLVGLTAGYNWQVNALVFGLEGDIDWSDMRGSFTNAACPLGCETRNNWLGTVRGRIGYAFNRVMPYVTGGLAVGDIEANPAGFAGVNGTNAGWTVGGGVEAALAGNWTAKLEYLYVDLGDVGCTAVACGVVSNVDFRTSIVRGGINFRF
jgi:outer membrane immunogenic protein